jgi:hypothetical protein
VLLLRAADGHGGDCPYLVKRHIWLVVFCCSEWSVLFTQYSAGDEI